MILCAWSVSRLYGRLRLMYGLPLSAQGMDSYLAGICNWIRRKLWNCYCKLLGIIPMRREYAEVCPSVFVGPCWARPQRRKTVAIGKLAPVLALIGKPPPLRMSPESMSIPEMRVGILLCIGRWKTVVLAVVAVLLQVGADTNARSDATSYTPLFWAAGWNANLIIAALLIEAEADVNTEESRDDSLTGSDGFPTYGYETTPLHIVE